MQQLQEVQVPQVLVHRKKVIQEFLEQTQVHQVIKVVQQLKTIKVIKMKTIMKKQILTK